MKRGKEHDDKKNEEIQLYVVDKALLCDKTIRMRRSKTKVLRGYGRTKLWQ